MLRFPYLKLEGTPTAFIDSNGKIKITGKMKRLGANNE